ncbi:MAG: hypothetical protein LBC61_04720 [Candidatus Peribacteria bacterium]|nr:hypothetical protein [Candidatus Peribacteria bacterium]
MPFKVLPSSNNRLVELRVLSQSKSFHFQLFSCSDGPLDSVVNGIKNK